MKNQKGFTLIELMLSIVLGSITTAAGVSLYIASQKTFVAQDTLSSNQIAIDKGLTYITDQIRLANMGKAYSQHTAKTPDAGIIIGATNYKYSFSTQKSNLSGQNTGPSFVNKASDQIVIQYKIPDGSAMDCEGGSIADSSIVVVEKYFVRSVADGSLAIACDAGRFTSAGAGSLTGMGVGVVDLIPNVDYLKVLLVTSSMTSNGSETLRVLTIPQYKALTTDRKIIGVKLGMISHSSASIGHVGASGISSALKVFNENLTINSSVRDAEKKYRYSINTRTISLYDGSGSYR